MIKEMEDYKAQLAQDRSIEEEFRAAVKEDKNKGVSKKSIYTISFFGQVQVLFTRQMQMVWGNKFDIVMTCGGCSGAVERVLKKLDGMEVHSPP